MSDDYWSQLAGREKSDDEGDFAAFGRQQPENASWVGVVFLYALDKLELTLLEALVTPESLPHWGDFSAAQKMLLDVEDRGVGSTANRAHEARDVAYVKVLAHVTEGFVVTEEQPIFVALIVTLVWRPELGAWKVHSLGDSLKPEVLPRTSPNVAPRDDIGMDDRPLA